MFFREQRSEQATQILAMLDPRNRDYYGSGPQGEADYAAFQAEAAAEAAKEAATRLEQFKQEKLREKREEA